MASLPPFADFLKQVQIYELLRAVSFYRVYSLPEKAESLRAYKAFLPVIVSGYIDQIYFQHRLQFKGSSVSFEYISRLAISPSSSGSGLFPGQ
jgi:hypothetical protein